MSGRKSLLSRVLLWLGVAAFCTAIAVACSVAQSPPAESAPAPPHLPAPAVLTPPPMGTAATEGLAYARAACADCHQVDPLGPEPAYSRAPAFHEIAITPGMTSIALLAWLHSSHPNMPQLVVPRDRLDYLLAYFDYLRQTNKKQAGPAR
ncbi:MAG: hypothetical protein QM773_04520 [Hyphomonadaceae bacterium]